MPPAVPMQTPAPLLSARAFEGLPGAVLAVLAALAVAYLLAAYLTRGVRAMLVTLVGRQYPPDAVQALVRRPVRIVRSVAFVLLSLALVFPALDLAGYDMPVGVHREAQLRGLLGSGVRIATIAFVAWLLIRLAREVVASMEREAAAGFGADAVERGRRVRTLGTVLRSVLGALIVVAALLMILRELRIDIVPLLAGAGIAGLAIGFGAQTLVKDMIAGFFMILENQVRVGDVVVINGQSGMVEALTLRTIVLRDVEGTVHVIPNGSVTALANQTKDYSFALIDAQVARHEDPDRVIGVLQAVAATLRSDPVLGPIVLAPLEVFGVEGFPESAMTVRVRLKTVPLRQWEVAREFRRRLKKAFDAEGIALAVPQRVVQVRDAGLSARGE